MQEEYDLIKKISGGQPGNKNQSSRGGQNDHPVEPKEKTRAVIAKEHGISESEVKRSVEFGRGLDAAESVEPGFTSAVLDGTIKASCKDISALRNKDGKELEEAVQAIIEKPEKKVNTVSRIIYCNRFCYLFKVGTGGV